jgi:hypothetical protein
MPKDEFDFEDPLELNGVAFPTDEDTTDAMCECFIEEFMRLGYSAPRLLALFRNPNYIGMHMVLEKRGEAFVRDMLEEVFARWGRTCVWTASPAQNQPGAAGCAAVREAPLAQTIPSCAELTDPMGNAIPKLEL